MTGEHAMLLDILQSQRNHILKTVADMPTEWLETQALPSRWSPAGLIHHLTHDVERFWFLKVLRDDPTWQGMPEGMEAWDVPVGMSGAEIVEEYRTETSLISEMLAKLELDTASMWWDNDLFGHPGPDNLHEILLHVIVETATHAGHMDIVRELHDGRQNMVFTDETRPGRSNE